MLQGRPLYDNLADATYFVEPRDWTALLRAVDRRLNIIVAGRRGIGKTTLLRQLQRVLREAETRVVFVEASAIDDPAELAARARNAMLGRPGATSASNLVESLAALDGDANPPVAGASRAFYATLQSLADADPTVVLVDASASANAVYGVFGRMRDTLWQLPHTWVVAVDDADRATALKPPADAFFDAVIDLSPPSTEDLRRLLSLRDADVSPALLAQLAEHAHNNPRAALRALGQAELNDSDPTTELEDYDRLEIAASRLGRPHGMLMAELLLLGRGSPSDDHLQRSLGITRARLNALLRELLENGLVVATPERGDGPGRPRLIYRPALERHP